MSVPAIVLDGAMPYGSRIETINGTAYKCNNISITRPVAEAQDNDTDGREQRARYTSQRAQLTAELQLPNAGTRPQFGQTFTDTFDANYGAETFVLMPVEYQESNDPTGIRVIPLSARKVIQSITTVA